jgi:hypothetical protein
MAMGVRKLVTGRPIANTQVYYDHGLDRNWTDIKMTCKTRS